MGAKEQCRAKQNYLSGAVLSKAASECRNCREAATEISSAWHDGVLSCAASG